MRIVVHVEGGSVQGVYADGPIEVEVVDFDNLETEGQSRESRDHTLDRAIAGLREVL